MAENINTLESVAELCNFIHQQEQQFDFWQPARTGGVSKDTQLGMFYARQFMETTHRYPWTDDILNNIVRDMRNSPYDEVANGFFSVLGNVLNELLQRDTLYQQAIRAWGDAVYWHFHALEEKASKGGAA